MISKNSLANLSVLTQIIKDLGSFLFNYDLVIDSRRVNSQSIFCAYPGFSSDGRNYIDSAISNGARVILYEADVDKVVNATGVFAIPVVNLKHYIGLLAAYKYSHPSNNFYNIGVTGTNGKTSITHWLTQAYVYLGKKSAIIGTTGAGIYPEIKDYESTTPDPITLQKLLHEFALNKIEVMSMEVSSHSLHQGRVNGVKFKTAIFTNLTQDHLDYHKTLHAYFLAKRELFYWQSLETIVINADDEYGKKLIDELSETENSSKVVTYGINSGEVSALNIKVTVMGTSFTLLYNGQEYEVMTKVIGRFNVYNILAVIASFIKQGYEIEKVLTIIKNLNPVCGRMDTIKEKGQPLVVIDYSHTPDALENALNTLCEIEHIGKIYCVFGCGGNRDISKRAVMGEIATRIADFCYITSDNPRSEDPSAIIDQIVQGTINKNYLVIENREDAITCALESANTNDVILIAGKGHEAYQEIHGVKYHFSDFEIAKRILNKARK